MRGVAPGRAVLLALDAPCRQAGAVMLVRELVVGGLRSYGPDPIDVGLAPLTLVFGPNSAGKSSLLSVLPLLRQSASRRDRLVLSGELVDAGSFRSAIHGHDETLPMTLGLGWTGPDGASPRRLRAEYRWDQARGLALRSAVELEAGGPPVRLEGPPPWDPESTVAATYLQDEMIDVLDRVAFLGPMRARPARTTILGAGGGHYVGPAGEGTAEILHRHPDLVEQVNDWCGRLGFGYRVRMLEPVSRDIVLAAGDLAVLGLLDVRQDPPVLVSPHAVGYGVGQLLPVITQCLLSRDGAVLVEQPEVHLHPRLQSAAGDLFVDTVTSGRAQVLVETHSEHLLLRLLRRVREGVLAPSDLCVLYVDMHLDGRAAVRRLDVDDDGELVDGWPGTFFGERLDDVLGGRG